MMFSKLLLYMLIGLSGISCNSKEKQTSVPSEAITITEASEQQTDTPDEYPFTYYSDNYSMIQRGIYKPKSTDKEYIRAPDNIINSYLVPDTAFIKGKRCMYIANDEPIALFDKKNPQSKEDVAGIFNGGSLVLVDTVFYNAVYINSDKAPMTFNEWYSFMDNKSLEFDNPPLTYDVWYAIRINGKKYYTDYKLHNYIEFHSYIPSMNQILLICSQATGYDGGYDIGYPDFYEVAVLGKSGHGWKQFYRSQKLDLNNGGVDEYGIGEYFVSDESWTGLDKQGNFVIKLDNLCKMIWDGKKLSVNWYNNN